MTSGPSKPASPTSFKKMFLLCVAMGMAGTPEDIVVAGNRDLAVEERQPAFERLVSGQDVAELVKVGKDTDRTVSERWVAIRALGLVPTVEARQALVDFLDHGDVWARIAASGAAGERGDRTMAGKVAMRLADPAILVRAAAADALGKLRDPGTLGDLERALKDPSSWYRGTSLWIRRKYVEAMADYCHAEIARRDLAGPCRVLAMSLGAMVAVAWAQRHPGDLAAVQSLPSSPAAGKLPAPVALVRPARQRSPDRDGDPADDHALAVESGADDRRMAAMA